MEKYHDAFAKILEIIQSDMRDGDGFAVTLRQNQIPHLSFSQISTVESCGFRYLLQYIECKEPEPYPDYFQKGKIFHQIIARRYEKMRENQRHNLAEDRQFIEENYHGSHQHHLQNALVTMDKNLWDECQVEAIEYPFVTMIDQNLPPFVGVIDLILNQDGTLMVIDHKTGRDFNEPDILQMSIYRDYIQNLYPGHSVRTFYDHYRWVENLPTIRKPAMQRREVILSDDDFTQSIKRVRKGYAKIENIRKHHKPERDGNCFPCPYRGNCHY